jgi:hypothetical protein
VAYREQDPERARQTAQEREVAGWIQTMDANRAQRVQRSRRLRRLVPLLILAGVFCGTAIAVSVATATRARDPVLAAVIGGGGGFIVAVAAAFRLAFTRRDGLDP